MVFAALSVLGFAFLSDSLNAGILFLPRLFVALVLLLVGLVLSELVRGWVGRLAGQMDLPGPVDVIAQMAVLAVFAVTALAQIGVPTEVLLLVTAIVLSAAALTLALAFGLGGRDVAREVSARRYVEGSFGIGQEVSLNGVRGRIAAFEATGTLLETAAGERLRVPNSQLVASVVTLHSRRRTELRRPGEGGPAGDQQEPEGEEREVPAERCAEVIAHVVDAEQLVIDQALHDVEHAPAGEQHPDVRAPRRRQLSAAARPAR